MTVITAIDAFAGWTGRLVAWLIVPLVGVMVYEVVARYAFHAPTFWAHDISFMLYGAFFMLGAAYTLCRKGHIRTDFFYSNFSVRWQGFVDTVSYFFFFFPGLAFFLWFGWESFYDSWRLGERAITTPWMPPIYPLKSVIPVTAGLLLLQGVSEAIKSVYALVKGRWL